MPNFSVKTTNLKTTESQFNDIKSCLESAFEDVKRVSNASSLGTSRSFAQIKKELNNTCTDIIDYKNTLSKLKVSLEEIIELYDKTEGNILSNTDVAFMDLQEIKTEEEKNISSGIEKLKDRIREWLNTQPDSDADDDLKVWLKHFFKGNDLDGDGLIDSFLGYFDDIGDFLNWWVGGNGDTVQGYAAVCDLTKTSSNCSSPLVTEDSCRIL